MQKYGTTTKQLVSNAFSGMDRANIATDRYPLISSEIGTHEVTIDRVLFKNLQAGGDALIVEFVAQTGPFENRKCVYFRSLKYKDSAFAEILGLLAAIFEVDKNNEKELTDLRNNSVELLSKMCDDDQIAMGRKIVVDVYESTTKDGKEVNKLRFSPPLKK